MKKRFLAFLQRLSKRTIFDRSNYRLKHSAAERVRMTGRYRSMYRRSLKEEGLHVTKDNRVKIPKPATT